ncbi:hypothetical protein O7623_05780 [Solwaraspora sp. WMMD791]|uniref:hypothetical protein n=1 Tax=Solwaraspora sp. WMMD791 TaxID=3016086 RepID=UPI00249CAFAC|nr:hypothetical protein [Solwaraspora sp. WMMD791]WFE28708.1 hypothetical protein O7623_05780 [Solwaraspora sp. WMMD791]
MPLSDPPQVMLASCTALPEGDGDEAELVDALSYRGVAATWRPWGGPVAPQTLVVLRATWDYPDQPAAFLRWCAEVPWLANPADLVRYNADKRYLLDLHSAGVATIPTTVVDLGDPAAAAPESITGGAEYVVKPVVGAGSRGAGRFGPGMADQARGHCTSRGSPPSYSPTSRRWTPMVSRRWSSSRVGIRTRSGRDRCWPGVPSTP